MSCGNMKPQPPPKKKRQQTMPLTLVGNPHGFHQLSERRVPCLVNTGLGPLIICRWFQLITSAGTDSQQFRPCNKDRRQKPPKRKGSVFYNKHLSSKLRCSYWNLDSSGDRKTPKIEKEQTFELMEFDKKNVAVKNHKLTTFSPHLPQNFQAPQRRSKFP